jgi:NADH-quinone oxidoreductase subunit C
VDICRYLHATEGLDYKFLSDITAVDYHPQEPRFAVCYHLLSMRWNQRLRLRVWWSDGDDDVPSITGIWQSAIWEEREAHDMYGIPFDGHPDLRRLLMPDDWQGHPGRRDYPLGYETVQFSFNYDEVNKHKPYAKE